MQSQELFSREKSWEKVHLKSVVFIEIPPTTKRKRKRETSVNELAIGGPWKQTEATTSESYSLVQNICFHIRISS